MDKDYQTYLDDFNQKLVENGETPVKINTKIFDIDLSVYTYPGSDQIGLLMLETEQNSDIDMDTLVENFLIDYAEQEIVIESDNDSLDKLEKYEPIMYIFVNSELKMDKGKVASQVGHVVTKIVDKIVSEQYEKNEANQPYIDWKYKHSKLVVLSASQKELSNLAKMDKCVVIQDAGRTQVSKNSLTCIGFHPMYKKDVPSEFSRFKLL
jgi:peptidyl-tRNA hydrolase